MPVTHPCFELEEVLCYFNRKDSLTYIDVLLCLFVIKHLYFKQVVIVKTKKQTKEGNKIAINLQNTTNDVVKDPFPISFPATQV